MMNVRYLIMLICILISINSCTSVSSSTSTSTSKSISESPSEITSYSTKTCYNAHDKKENTSMNILVIITCSFVFLVFIVVMIILMCTIIYKLLDRNESSFIRKMCCNTMA